MRDNISRFDNDELYGSADARVYLDVDSDGVGVKIKAAHLKNPMQVGWARPDNVCTKHGTCITTAIRNDMWEDIHTKQYEKVIMLLWYSADPNKSLPDAFQVKQWATQNPTVDIVLFTNCKPADVRPAVVYPLEALNFKVTFPINTFLYDFVDFAKLKMLDWGLKHKYEICMVADYPKLAPLQILDRFWDTIRKEGLDIMFGHGGTTSTLQFENWLYIAKPGLTVPLQNLIRIYEEILTNVGEALLPRLNQGLSASIVKKLYLYIRKIREGEAAYVEKNAKKDIAAGLRSSVAKEFTPPKFYQLNLDELVQWLNEHGELPIDSFVQT